MFDYYVVAYCVSASHITKKYKRYLVKNLTRKLILCTSCSTQKKKKTKLIKNKWTNKMITLVY